MSRPVSALAALSIATLAVSGCSSSSSVTKTVNVPALSQATTAPGIVTASSMSIPRASGASPVITPSGSTQVLIGQLAPTGLSNKTVVTAPRGSSVLPLSWTFSANTSAVSAGNLTTSLVVTAGSHSWLVSKDVSRSGSALITVPTTDASKVSVAVVFDGLAQYVNPHTDAPLLKSGSPASVYYDGHTLTGRSVCPPITSGSTNANGLSFQASCGFTTITRSPWLPGRGWASSGQQWVNAGVLITDGQMQFKDAAGKIAHYPNPTSTITYATSGSSNVLSLTRQNSQTTALIMVKQSANVPLSLTQEYTGKASGSTPADAPIQQTVTLVGNSTIVFDPLNSAA